MEWQLSTLECPNCGSRLEVFNEIEQDSISTEAYDGDELRCSECTFESNVVVNEDLSLSIN